MNGSPVKLTARQLAVVTGLASSLSTKAVAAQLGISPKTVEFHRLAACRKLGFVWYDLAGLTRFAIRERLIDINDPSLET